MPFEKGNKAAKKAPTEEITLSDIWNSFEADYLPFVEWIIDTESNERFIVIEFQNDAPDSYTNKWGREQWKMEVIQEGSDHILSGGKRMWQTLKRYCIAENRLPSALGYVKIIRKGSGFDTQYEFQSQ